MSWLARPGDVLRAGAVCRHWRELLRHDHVWEPLCRAFKALGLATGWDMLAKVKARPECQLSWKQLFVQRARSRRRPEATLSAATHARPEDYLIGVEVHLLGSRTRVLLDAEDDELIVGAMREVMVRERKVRSVQQTGLGLSTLLVYLQDKTTLIRLARQHAVELFGIRSSARDEWVVLQTVQLAEELLPAEPMVKLPKLDPLPLKRPQAFASYILFKQEQTSRWERRKQRELPWS